MVKPTLSPEQKERLKRLRTLAGLLDEAMRLPGTQYRVGFDALIGLVPVLGDLVSTGLALYIVREAARLEVPNPTLLRMIANVGVDFLIGSVPVAGDAFDLVWKANKKNLALLEAYLKEEGLLDEEPYIDV